MAITKQTTRDIRKYQSGHRPGAPRLPSGPYRPDHAEQNSSTAEGEDSGKSDVGDDNSGREEAPSAEPSTHVAATKNDSVVSESTDRINGSTTLSPHQNESNVREISQDDYLDQFTREFYTEQLRKAPAQCVKALVQHAMSSDPTSACRAKQLLRELGSFGPQYPDLVSQHLLDLSSEEATSLLRHLRKGSRANDIDETTMAPEDLPPVVVTQRFPGDSNANDGDGVHLTEKRKASEDPPTNPVEESNAEPVCKQSKEGPPSTQPSRRVGGKITDEIDFSPPLGAIKRFPVHGDGDGKHYLLGDVYDALGMLARCDNPKIASFSRRLLLLILQKAVTIPWLAGESSGVWEFLQLALKLTRDDPNQEHLHFLIKDAIEKSTLEELRRGRSATLDPLLDSIVKTVDKERDAHSLHCKKCEKSQAYMDFACCINTSAIRYVETHKGMVITAEGIVNTLRVSCQSPDGRFDWDSFSNQAAGCFNAIPVSNVFENVSLLFPRVPPDEHKLPPEGTDKAQLLAAGPEEDHDEADEDVILANLLDNSVDDDQHGHDGDKDGGHEESKGLLPPLFDENDSNMPSPKAESGESEEDSDNGDSDSDSSGTTADADEASSAGAEQNKEVEEDEEDDNEEDEEEDNEEDNEEVKEQNKEVEEDEEDDNEEDKEEDEEEDNEEVKEEEDEEDETNSEDVRDILQILREAELSYTQCPAPRHVPKDQGRTDIGRWRQHLYPTLMGIVVQSLKRREMNYSMEAIYLARNLHANWREKPDESFSKFLEQNLCTWSLHRDGHCLLGYQLELKRDTEAKNGFIHKYIQHIRDTCKLVNATIKRTEDTLHTDSYVYGIMMSRKHEDKDWDRLSLLGLHFSVVRSGGCRVLGLNPNNRQAVMQACDLACDLTVKRCKREKASVEVLWCVCQLFDHLGPKPSQDKPPQDLRGQFQGIWDSTIPLRGGELANIAMDFCRERYETEHETFGTEYGGAVLEETIVRQMKRAAEYLDTLKANALLSPNKLRDRDNSASHANKQNPKPDPPKRVLGEERRREVWWSILAANSNILALKYQVIQNEETRDQICDQLGLPKPRRSKRKVRKRKRKQVEEAPTEEEVPEHQEPPPEEEVPEHQEPPPKSPTEEEIPPKSPMGDDVPAEEEEGPPKAQMEEEELPEEGGTPKPPSKSPTEEELPGDKDSTPKSPTDTEVREDEQRRPKSPTEVVREEKELGNDDGLKRKARDEGTSEADRPKRAKAEEINFPRVELELDDPAAVAEVPAVSRERGVHHPATMEYDTDDSDSGHCLDPEHMQPALKAMIDRGVLRPDGSPWFPNVEEEQKEMERKLNRLNRSDDSITSSCFSIESDDSDVVKFPVKWEDEKEYTGICALNGTSEEWSLTLASWKEMEKFRFEYGIMTSPTIATSFETHPLMVLECDYASTAEPMGPMILSGKVNNQARHRHTPPGCMVLNVFSDCPATQERNQEFFWSVQWLRSRRLTKFLKIAEPDDEVQFDLLMSNLDTEVGLKEFWKHFHRGGKLFNAIVLFLLECPHGVERMEHVHNGDGKLTSHTYKVGQNVREMPRGIQKRCLQRCGEIGMGLWEAMYDWESLTKEFLEKCEKSRGAFQMRKLLSITTRRGSEFYNLDRDDGRFGFSGVTMTLYETEGNVDWSGLMDAVEDSRGGNTAQAEMQENLQRSVFLIVHPIVWQKPAKKGRKKRVRQCHLIFRFDAGHK